MSFYGLPDGDDKMQVYQYFSAVRDLYDQAQQPSFFGDNMVALCRNMSFAHDDRFMAAFRGNERDSLDKTKVWRLHTYCWAGRSALAIPGDFVECGVFEGLYSAVLLEYLSFETVAKAMYLFDTFSGLSDEYSTPLERHVVGGAYKGRANWFERVLARFERYANVTVTRGIVPEVFDEVAPSSIALLHLDMNAAAAEVGALEVLFDRVNDGGLILLDDYGRNETKELYAALRDWMADRRHPILELPTGQGLVVKRISV